MIGWASTAPTALAGRSRKAIWRRPASSVVLNDGRFPTAAKRESVGKSTVTTATENIPWGSM